MRDVVNNENMQWNGKEPVNQQTQQRAQIETDKENWQYTERDGTMISTSEYKGSKSTKNVQKTHFVVR